MVWWLKYALAVAAAVVTLAGAARVLGVTVDIETRTEARAQHDELEAKIKRDLRDEHARALERIERAISGLGSRIDRLMERGGRK